MDKKRPKYNATVWILLLVFNVAAMLYAFGYFKGMVLMGPEMEAVVIITVGILVTFCSIGLSLMSFRWMMRGWRDGQYCLSGRAISRPEKPIEFVATGIGLCIYGIVFLFLALMGVVLVAGVAGLL